MISNIEISNDGYIKCNSCYYTSHDILNNNVKYHFSTGVNELIGDIDSGCWAISYILSMFNETPNDIVLFEPDSLLVNDIKMSLTEFQQYSCYLDTTSLLYSDDKTVKSQIEHGLKLTGINDSSDNICDIFRLTPERFERPLSGVGNELYSSLAAIGYSQGKQVFCFPWFSRTRYEWHYTHIADLLNTLTELQKIIILPIGK